MYKLKKKSAQIYASKHVKLHDIIAVFLIKLSIRAKLIS